jgi:hypothetical protein
MIYDIKKGYGLQLTKFDEQYQDTIIYRQSKREIIELADKIISTFRDVSLMSQLNDMQSNTHYFKNGEYVYDELFENKFEIPAYFINLILSKYGMSVRGLENDIPKIGDKS